MALLLGKKGQLAWAMQKQFKSTLKVFGKTELNLMEIGSIAPALDKARPDLLINATGMHDPVRVQKDVDASATLNVKAVTEMAKWAAKNNIVFIHVTGVDVFDGKGSEFRQESEKTNPVNVLGQQWAEAEANIQKAGGKHLIFRTSWLYSAVGTNFVKTVLQSPNAVFDAVSDQYSSPTSAMELAKAITRVLEKIQGLPQIPSGIYHATGHGITTPAEWAQEILNQGLGLGFRTNTQKIKQVKLADVMGDVPRPVNARLSNQKMLRAFGVQLPAWPESLIKSLHDLRKAE